MERRRTRLAIVKWFSVRILDETAHASPQEVLNNGSIRCLNSFAGGREVQDRDNSRDECFMLGLMYEGFYNATVYDLIRG